MSDYKIKNFSNSFLYNTKINRAAKDNPGQVANKEIKDFIITSHRIDKNNTQAFRGFVEDVKRQQGTAVLTSVLLDPRVVLCIGNAPLPRAFAVFEAKDSKSGGRPIVFIDLTGRVEYKDGFYVIRRGMIDQICALLMGAMIYLLYRNNQNKLLNNAALTNSITECYTAMFTYIIDYLRILGYAQNKSKIAYTVALFFLTNHMNYDVDDNYAKNIASKIVGLNAREVQAYDLYLRDIDFTNIGTFLPTMAQSFNLKGLDLSNFVAKWMYLYGTGTEYAIELYTSFASLICTAYLGCYMVNWNRIETCCGSPNLVKVATSIIKAGNDTFSKIYMDSTDLANREVHDKATSELAESMKARAEIDQMSIKVLPKNYASIDEAKEAAQNVIDTCKKTLLENKLDVFAERSIGSGIEAAYNASMDLLEGKVTVEEFPYAIGSLTEVAKCFKNKLGNSQRHTIEATVNRDIDQLSTIVRESEAPKEIASLVSKTILELRQMQQYI